MVKTVSFRLDEKELIDFIETKYFSSYIKELIKKDMLSQDFKPFKKVEEEKTKQRRNANFDM